MDTTFFNVGHGETVYIELNYKDMHGIVRDFGRSRYALKTPKSYDLQTLSRYFKWIKDNIQLDAVLSHAHEDHFNGFELLYKNGERNIFENGYIPLLKMTDLNSLGGILIKYSIFMYRYYHKSSLIAANAKNWLLAAPIMASLSKRLWCVCQGHQVKHWSHYNKVLWPPLNNQYADDLKKRWTEYIMQNDLGNDFIENDAESIRKILKKYYDEDSESREINNEVSTLDIEEIISILDSSSLEDQRSSFTSPQSLKNNLYNPTIDNHSLIFEIDDIKKEKLYLFLSDADDKTIRLMLNSNSISDKDYFLIKSSHHGNRGARSLIKNNIKSEYVVNCCGPAHNNWKSPDLSYKKVSDCVVCTDWHNTGKKWSLKDKSQYCFSKTRNIYL